MKPNRLGRWVVRLAPLAGLLLGNGCLAVGERTFDMIVAPQAVGNLLRVPFSGLGPLAGLVFRIVN